MIVSVRLLPRPAFTATLFVLSVAALLTLSAAAQADRRPAHGAPAGSLQRLTSRGACVGVGCSSLRGARGPLTFVLSPDGNDVYGAATNGSIVALARDPRTGRLRQLFGRSGCVTRDPTDGCTTDARLARLPLAETRPLMISRDGRSAYELSVRGVGVLARDRRTGGLSPVPGSRACVSFPRPGCRVAGHDLAPQTIASVGSDVYVVFGGARDTFLVRYRRDATSGALTRVPDATGGCLDTKGKLGCTASPCIAIEDDLAVSNDGSDLYVAATDSSDEEASAPGNVITFRRARSGALSELGCFHTRTAAVQVLPVPHTQHVLVAGLFGNRGTGRAYNTIDTYAPGPDGALRRIVAQSPCRRAEGPKAECDSSSGMAVSPSGHHVYWPVDYVSPKDVVRVGLTAATVGHGIEPLGPAPFTCVLPSVARRIAGCSHGGPELQFARPLISPDGRFLYAAVTHGSGRSAASGLETFAIRR